MRKVGSWGPGVEPAEPDIIPAPTKGVFKLAQAGANGALPVAVEHLDHVPPIDGNFPMVMECSNNIIPFRSGVHRAGRHICVVAVEMGPEGSRTMPTGLI